MKLITRPGAKQAPRYLSDMLPEDTGQVMADLSANENPLGPSVASKDAFTAAVENLWRYPDGACETLRSALAVHFKADATRITCGAGSDELITLITRIFAGQGDEVIYSEYGFVMFPINIIRAGATPVKTQALGRGTDVNAMIAGITEKTRIIFLANPNNPTGTCLNARELYALASQIPPHVIFVIDSAYAEYVDWPDYEDGMKLADQFPNVIMLRTFSKFYGLAGLRLGWCYASAEIIDLLERARGPYNVSLPAQAAGSVALSDLEHAQRTLEHNRIWRKNVSEGMQKCGIAVEESAANFVLAEFPDAEIAGRAWRYLLAHGILTRPLAGYQLPECLRITIGLPEQNQQLIEVLGKFSA